MSERPFPHAVRAASDIEYVAYTNGERLRNALEDLDLVISLLRVQCAEGTEEPLINTIGAINNISYYSGPNNKLLRRRREIAGGRNPLTSYRRVAGAVASE